MRGFLGIDIVYRRQLPRSAYYFWYVPVLPLDLGKGLGIAGEEGFFKWVKQEFLLSYVSALKLSAAASGTCTGRFGRASAATGRITGSRETWA